MSTGHVLTNEEKVVWQKRIMDICIQALTYKSFHLLCYFIQQLYEYCVACECKENNKPIKLKLLSNVYLENSWSSFCYKLYGLRNYTTHNNYIRHDFTAVLEDKNYNLLIERYFNRDDWKYLKLLRLYYTDCLQEV